MSGASIAAVAFAVLIEISEEDFLPHTPAWSSIIIWASAHVAGKIAARIKMPALLGMLLSGILLRNIPGDPVQVRIVLKAT